ncbi:MAG TPA: glycosyltransferase [Gemmatimonadaceae bacterium]|nr:glycosyltransferase [Gemmatimonadaceae bacterium]HRQ77453.1 glycosyltransferase [Gemmatimonadaceae bacterium]
MAGTALAGGKVTPNDREEAKLRVTQVVFDLDGGGLETLVGEMVRRWAGTSICVSVVTLSGRAGRIGAAVRGLTEQFHVLKPLPGASMVLPLGLARAIRRTRPDVLHSHSGAWFKSALAARISGVRGVVYTEHGREHHDPPMQQRIDRLAARWTHTVVPVSDRLGNYMTNAMGLNPAKICPVPNGVDTDRYAPGNRDPQMMAALSLPDDALVFGSIGRLERVKRYDRMLEALAAMPAVIGGRPVFLVLFGEGSARAQLEQRARALGVSDRVRMPGWVMDTPAAQRVLDVFSLTSESEGMSVSLLESMSSGAAAVVNAVGANAELLGPEWSGQVVRDFDPESYRAALHRTLHDESQRVTMGQRVRDRVEKHYSLTAMMRAYESIYRRVASGAMSRRGAS